MLNIGITGQAGFIGTHLFNYFGLKNEEVTRIPFRDEYFSDLDQLGYFVKQCDVIIHLAALNRHNDPQTIYDTNILLVQKLIASMEATDSRPHVLFSSSTQEERDNMFGKSKREGRELLAVWAEKNNAKFTGLIIPNVFGPFGNPYYNSVVATFCHQVTHNEQPKIDVDAELRLIYIGDLVEIFWEEISRVTSDKRQETNLRSDGVGSYPPLEEVGGGQSSSDKKQETSYKEKDDQTFRQSDIQTIRHLDIQTSRQSFIVQKTVTQLLEIINRFKTDYYDRGVFPELNDKFERDLFNTFRCYINVAGYYPVKLKLNTDDRGTFVETVKLNMGGQVSFSTTKPGIIRGNHFHTRKIERFAVIKGKARIQLRRIGTCDVLNFDIDGDEPAYVDMPIWYTHNITNTGTEDLYTIFWINEFYDPKDSDTYMEEV